MNGFSTNLAELLAIPKEVKLDRELLWKLEDKQFFAAGACHVLAFAYKDIFENAGYDIYLIHPKSTRGTHVFVSNGEWVFDSRGYQRHLDFMNEYSEACHSLFGDWEYEILKIEESFDEFCVKHNHRTTDKFMGNPFQRAYRFIESFVAP